MGIKFAIMPILPILCICETAKLKQILTRIGRVRFNSLLEPFYGLLSTPTWLLSHENGSDVFKQNIRRHEREVHVVL